MKGLITGAALLATTVYGPSQSYTSTQSIVYPSFTQSISDATTSTSTIVISAAKASSASAVSDFKDNTGIISYVKRAYSDEPVLINIARCESSFRQYDEKTGTVLHGKANPADIGVMQINEKYHLERAASMGIDIDTVEGNVAYAKYLYDTQGGAPWSASKACWSTANAVSPQIAQAASNQMAQLDQSLAIK